MLKVFNAFQIVAAFAGGPFLIGWLATGPFPYAGAAMILAAIIYLIGFCGMTGLVAENLQ